MAHARTSKTQAPQGKGLRQAMSGLHIWAGLLAGWLLYAMFLTGTVSYFRVELSQWMRPEMPALKAPADPARAVGRVVRELDALAQGSAQWVIYPPDPRGNAVTVFWREPVTLQGSRRMHQAIFDPTTGRRADVRATAGGDFFYHFHYQFHYLPMVWGRWLAGVCAMFMLVAIISGVITHKKILVDFFTFRGGKGQRSWLDAHNAFSVFGLPFHLMITFSGLVMLMATYLPWSERLAIQTAAQRAHMANQQHAFHAPLKASGERAPLASVQAMVGQAQHQWGAHNIARVIVNLPGDTHARVSVLRGEVRRVSFSPQYMLFDGVSGALLEQQDSVGIAAQTRGVLYGLHLGRFGDVHLRWLYFIVSLAGTAMVGTGLVLWTVKRRQRMPSTPQRPGWMLSVMERGNVAAMAGLSVAMVVMLWANRLLPVTMPERDKLEIQCFFLAWGVMWMWVLCQPARKSWRAQLWLAAVLLFGLPVVNALTTERAFWRSLAAGDTVFAGMDAVCWAFAALHGVLAWRCGRQTAREARP